jgi:hypothetical protein
MPATCQSDWRVIDIARERAVKAAILRSYKLVNFLYDQMLCRKPALSDRKIDSSA